MVGIEALGEGLVAAIEQVRTELTSGRTTGHVLEFFGEAIGVGENGIVLKGDGNTWTGEMLSTEPNFSAVWVSPGGTVWASDWSGSIYERTGNTWTERFSADGYGVQAIWGLADDDAWSVGNSGRIRHWDGATWTSVTSGTTQTLRAVHGTASAGVWAVGAGATLLHYVNDAWESVSVPNSSSLWGVAVTAEGHVFVVGDNGFCGEYDPVADSWTTRYSPWFDSLRDLSLSPDGTLFTVGQQGRAYRYKDGIWSVDSLPLRMQGQKVWASAANRAWAILERGRIAYFDGNAWSLDSHLSDTELYDLYGNTASDLVAVGDAAKFQRYIP